MKNFKIAALVLSALWLTSCGSEREVAEKPNIPLETSVELRLVGKMNKYPRNSYSSGWGYAATPDGREYALLGARHGTSIIDITDESDIKEIAFIKGANSHWREIKTYSHYAYVVNETGGGLQVIDLSRLPNEATLVYTYKTALTAHTLWVDAAHQMLYVEGERRDKAPLRVLSLADPAKPVQVSTFGIYSHDLISQGNRLYVSEGRNHSIGIFDLTNPAEPALIKRFPIPRAGFVHNSAPTEDGRYLLTTEEVEGHPVKIWDIGNLDDIRLVGTYLGPNRLAHNVYVRSHFAVLSHYGAGLRVVDIADPTHPREVAYWKKSRQAPYGFTGAWGAYPFLPSGRILIFDIENGLFITEPFS